MKKIEKSVLKKTIMPRNPISYKGNYGRVLIIAGSLHFGGAAILSSSAAVFTGAGLVTVASVPEKFSAINSRIPEAMTIDYSDIIETIGAIGNNDVIVIGPGLGTSHDTVALVNLVLDNTTKSQTVIVDASALTVIAQEKIDLTKTAANIILTPHQGEWQRLSNLDIEQQTPENNLKAIESLNSKTLLIVKKHHSEIYYHGKVSAITNGNAGMATGGMGDTLTGIIAAMVGQFGFSLQTVSAGLFLHSYIADKIFKNNYVVLPQQLIELIPQEMKKIADKNAKSNENTGK